MCVCATGVPLFFIVLNSRGRLCCFCKFFGFHFQVIAQFWFQIGFFMSACVASFFFAPLSFFLVLIHTIISSFNTYKHGGFYSKSEGGGRGRGGEKGGTLVEKKLWDGFVVAWEAVDVHSIEEIKVSTLWTLCNAPQIRKSVCKSIMLSLSMHFSYVSRS